MARLLVIEDEEFIGRFLSRALRSEGYDVDVCRSGPEGLASALSQSYDLILLDLMLPGMDGAEVLKELLRHRPEQRVLVLSAVPDVHVRVQLLELGALDFLAKPFAIAELTARVRTRLRLDAQPAPTPGTQPNTHWLDVAGLRLDLRRQELVAGGRAVALPRREFLLLAYLMRRVGQVCSRQELLAEVWGYSFDPGSNVVDVYISRLRAKLDGPRIETVRSVGYCLVVD